jgi:hypothetical protein
MISPDKKFENFINLFGIYKQKRWIAPPFCFFLKQDFAALPISNGTRDGANVHHDDLYEGSS